MRPRRDIIEAPQSSVYEDCKLLFHSTLCSFMGCRKGGAYEQGDQEDPYADFGLLLSAKSLDAADLTF